MSDGREKVIEAVERRLRWSREILADPERTPEEKNWVRRYEIDTAALLALLSAEANGVILADALRDLSEWVVRMPDAGLDSDDPRFFWWNEGNDVRVAARTALELISSG